MEDGAVLGLVMHGATNRSQIEERLALYSKIRYYRASSIQILSNFGYDELDAVSDELTKYLGGAAVPGTPSSSFFLFFSYSTYLTIRSRLWFINSLVLLVY